MKTLIILFSGLMANFGLSQTVLNGDFNSMTMNWGCAPEATYFETTYGGSDPTNRVAEIDASAGLCQTIGGFIIGNTYSLRLDVSRRTTCGPTLQTMDVIVDGGALSTNVTRNGTPFYWVTESFVFVATNTTHTINFIGTVIGTCGLIVDNVSISSTVPLPVVLFAFNANELDDRTARIEWNTISEINNDYFELIKSTDGLNWNSVGTVAGNGTTNSTVHYAMNDENFSPGTSYYQLIQFDFNGETSYSSIIQLEKSKSNIVVSPNPANDQVTIASTSLDSFQILSANGQDCTKKIQVLLSTDCEWKLDISNLSSGTYLAVQNNEVERFVKK